jgi:hypothetical protein
MKTTVGFTHNVAMFLHEAIRIKGPCFESAYALCSEVHIARYFEASYAGTHYKIETSDLINNPQTMACPDIEFQSCGDLC